jgi:hypothetical protein
MIPSASEFCRLRESERPEESLRAAHEEAPHAVWRALIVNRPDMRVWVALNKTVPIEILDILSRDEDVEVRCTVAMKRKINEVIAVRLAKDSDERVRAALIHNKKLPFAAMMVLKTDSSEFVQKILNEK